MKPLPRSVHRLSAALCLVAAGLLEHSLAQRLEASRQAHALQTARVAEWQVEHRERQRRSAEEARLLGEYRQRQLFVHLAAATDWPQALARHVEMLAAQSGAKLLAYRLLPDFPANSTVDREHAANRPAGAPSWHRVELSLGLMSEDALPALMHRLLSHSAARPLQCGLDPAESPAPPLRADCLLEWPRWDPA